MKIIKTFSYPSSFLEKKKNKESPGEVQQDKTNLIWGRSGEIVEEDKKDCTQLG